MNSKLDRSGPRLKTPASPTAQDGVEKYDTGGEDREGDEEGARSPPTQDAIKLKVAKKEVTIGTWNVRTLNALGKPEQLDHEMRRYRWSVLGLAEVRWTGIGETTTDDGHTLWYSGEERLHERGVGFLVHKDVAKSVMECRPISSRLITMRLAGKPLNISLVQAYAPTSTASDEEMEQFYQQLQKSMATIPKKDVLLVMGDWNAKVGVDAYPTWKGTAGKCGFGITNDRGLALLEFAKFNDLVLANTLHPQKPSRKTTWHSPDGKTHNMIDHILINKRFQTSVNLAQTRTFTGADIGSDHDLLMTSLRVKLKRTKKGKSPRIKFDLEKLKDPDIAAEFQATIGGKFAPLLAAHLDIDSFNTQLNEQLIDTAEKLLGRARGKKQVWMSDKVLKICDKRRELKKKRFSSDSDQANYRQINKEVKIATKVAKEKWIQDQCTNIDRNMACNNTAAAFKTIKDLTRSKMTRTTVIEDKKGNLLTERTAIANRWKEYCEELYNYNLTCDKDLLEKLRSISATTEDEDPPILTSEIEAAIEGLKEGKSPGIDNVPAELLKNGGPITVAAYTKLCNEVWTSGVWPATWTQSVIIPLPKKGNLKSCNNYRTISLISHPSKILLRVILNRLRPQAERIIAEEQAGFRRGRSTAEQIFNLRMLSEKFRTDQKPLFHNFIDFKKAFDRVWQEGMCAIMRMFNISKGIVNAIEALYKASKSAVLLGDEISDWFSTRVGVRQGCLLSPTIFNVFLEYIMLEALDGFEGSVSIGGRTITNLRFADDIDLVAGNPEELCALTTRLENSAKQLGMQISAEKSKVMRMGSDKELDVSMDGEKLGNVTQFKYLGATITEDAKSVQEIKIRIAIATSSLAKLKPIWRDKNISMKTRMSLLRALVTSVFLYGCETWTLNAEMEKRINSFEMNCMRRLLQVHYTSHTSNKQIRELMLSYLGEHDHLLTIVKRKQLSWFGHVIRWKGSLANAMLQGGTDGSRKRGRPARTWLNNIKDWTGLNFQQLIRKAEDRQLWRSCVSSAISMSPQRLPSYGT